MISSYAPQATTYSKQDVLYGCVGA